MVHVDRNKSKLSEESYRPISIVWNVFKVFEKCLRDQMSNYFKDIFSKAVFVRVTVHNMGHERKIKSMLWRCLSYIINSVI